MLGCGPTRVAPSHKDCPQLTQSSRSWREGRRGPGTELSGGQGHRSCPARHLLVGAPPPRAGSGLRDLLPTHIHLQTPPLSFPEFVFHSVTGLRLQNPESSGSADTTESENKPHGL